MALDQTLYCLEADTGTYLWEFQNKNIKNTPRCRFNKPQDKTIATYRFENAFGSLQALGDQPAENVACSGNPSAEGTTPRSAQSDLRFSENDRDPISGNQRSINDAERKILESFAKAYNANYNKNIVNNHLEGSLFMFVNREACDQCQRLPQQFRKLFPKVNLLWVDSSGNCY